LNKLNDLIVVSTKQIHRFSSSIISYNVRYNDTNIEGPGYGISAEMQELKGEKHDAKLRFKNTSRCSSLRKDQREETHASPAAIAAA
jgi:hypothetical protein